MARHIASANYILIRLIFSFLLIISVMISAASSEDHGGSCYTSIISFGDSYSDTGNSLFAFDLKTLESAHPPYGETFFRRPTGRYCDGRLILDFIAQALGFPLLHPSLARLEPSIYRKGINFAVGGATALNSSFFAERSIGILTNFSLSVQMDWFNKLLPDLCSTTHHYQGCKELLKKSLVVVGGFGGNDYLRASLAGKTGPEILTYVPLVLKAVSDAISNLIEKGAVDVLVQGLTPGGCLPIILTLTGSTNISDYDNFGCLKTSNEFNMFHNSQLQATLQNLREAYPHARIMYADLYNASMSFYKYPSLFGFKNTLSACCGKGGLYNYNFTASCGNQRGIRACEYPSTYVNWDGIHLTEKSYEWITIGLLNGFFSHPSINIATKCYHSIPRNFPIYPN